MPAAQALARAETFAVTRRVPTVVVAPLGPTECGKTTLLATIYDQFQLGPYAGWLFAGSETLIGFERRSFLSRTVSGAPVAGTERTRISEGEQFLHLRLQREAQDAEPVEVLLADVSGELFERVRDRPSTAADVAALQAADVLAVLIDGKRLSEPREHHSVLQDARMLLRAVMQARSGANPPAIEFIVTKWDVLVASGRSESDVKEEVTNTIGRNIISADDPAEVYLTAARPGGRDVPWAYGCAPLLSAWLRPRDRHESDQPKPAPPDLRRHFDRYRSPVAL